MDSSITVKLIVGLIALLIVVRLLGKKELAQITPFDFVYLLILGGLLEDAVYDDLVTVWEVLYSIALWAILIYVIELIVRRFDKMKPILKGEPTIIVKDGKIDIDAMKKNKLEAEQFRSMLRLKGYFSLSEVKYAIIEQDGELSIMGQDFDKGHHVSLSHLLIDEGTIDTKILKQIDKDEEWLKNGLAESGYSTNIKDIFYCEWSETYGFVVRMYD